MTLTFSKLTALLSVFCAALAASAASPEMIRQGRDLFEREWASQNPTMGSDGLGPLFNANSCAACHNQGGIGGAGEAKFNAKTIGVNEMHIAPGPVPADVVLAAAKSFHPGLVDQNNVLVNTVPIAHHGGSSAFDRMRKQLMHNSLAKFSEAGGPVSAEEVRHANATPLLYTSKVGKHTVSVKARMYQRNTTSLFGAGLIDRVSGKQLEALVHLQERNPEVSGRIGTLTDGRFGRFGWRANVASLVDFCDKACAAEVGLQTRRKPQPADPTNRNYRNPAVDISDQQIQAMAAFVAALPSPQRLLPSDSQKQKAVLRGEQLFASVGCAQCHVPNLGPARGLYSDLLLHDMGFKSLDLNPAEPYIHKVEPASYTTRRSRSETTIIPTATSTMDSSYYGGTITMPLTTQMKVVTNSDSRRSITSPSRRRGYHPSKRLLSLNQDYRFVTSLGTKDGIISIIPTGSQTRAVTTTTTTDGDEDIDAGFDGRRRLTARGAKSESTTISLVTQSNALLVHGKGTLTTQEWRTPPLWGVRDSAPYMHDGRAETLLEAITMHEGESAKTRDRFLNLSLPDRHAIVAFLNTMVAPDNAPQPTS